MTTRTEFCEIVCSHVGTKYIHQGRLKNVGIDCAGLLVSSMKEAGIYTGGDYTGYSPVPDGNTLFMTLKDNLKEKDLNDLKAGDVLLMRFMDEPQHIAIYIGNDEIVHSYLRVRKCVRHLYNQEWKDRTLTCFEIPDLEEEEEQ